MGLDLVVYKNIKNVEIPSGEIEVKIDFDTGEIYFDNPLLNSNYKAGYFEAISERIGNISEIASLKDETSNLLGNQSAILRHIFSEENSCGTTLGKLEQKQIEEELIALQNHQITQEMNLFLEKLTKIVEEAKIQDNPIVFT